MIEKHIYQCEVCGKEFAFEDECREHEMKCKTAGLEKSVVMMNSLKTSSLLITEKRLLIERTLYTLQIRKPQTN